MDKEIQEKIALKRYQIISPILGEARVAWGIFQRLEELSNLLWDCYEDEFLDFTMDEEEEGPEALEQPLEAHHGSEDPLGSDPSQRFDSGSLGPEGR